MKIFTILKPPMVTMDEVQESHFLVVHPLDDVPEEKVDTSRLRPIPITGSVRLSLLALRTYLVLMMLLVVYHVIDLAHLLGQHAR